jgi:KDO2-lipid IV(A) lauroyltransferase
VYDFGQQSKINMFLLQIFRLVPFSVLYVLSDVLAFFLYRIIGYRKKVIFENLHRAFPEKSKAEIQKIASGTYKNLTDITLETLKSFTAPIAEIERRALCLNPELLNQYLDRGQSVILSGSHLGNWEYSGLVLPMSLTGTTVLVYKPLTNKKMDAFLNKARTRTGAATVAMKELVRALKNEATSSFVLLSDQSPSSRKSAHWIDFFGQDTASLPGADVLGRKFEMPVMYYLVHRTSRRGFYEIEFTELCADPSTAAEMDITRAYTRRLENDIRNQPEQWLWSHKRWKMKR